MRQIIDRFRNKYNDGQPLWCFEWKLAVASWVILIAIILSACSTPVTIANPCGVIRDSLRDVRGADASERRRVDIHFERGVAAGCWKRP